MSFVPSAGRIPWSWRNESADESFGHRLRQRRPTNWPASPDMAPHLVLLAFRILCRGTAPSIEVISIRILSDQSLESGTARDFVEDPAELDLIAQKHEVHVREPLAVLPVPFQNRPAEQRPGIHRELFQNIKCNDQPMSL